MPRLQCTTRPCPDNSSIRAAQPKALPTHLIQVVAQLQHRLQQLGERGAALQLAARRPHNLQVLHALGGTEGGEKARCGLVPGWRWLSSAWCVRAWCMVTLEQAYTRMGPHSAALSSKCTVIRWRTQATGGPHLGVRGLVGAGEDEALDALRQAGDVLDLRGSCSKRQARHSN